MEDYTAHDLLIEVALTKHPDCSFPNHCKGFRKNVIKGFTLFQPCLELKRFGSEFVVGQLLDFRLEGRHLFRCPSQPFQFPFICIKSLL